MEKCVMFDGFYLTIQFSIKTNPIDRQFIH